MAFVAGIDIGSITAKTVLMDEEGLLIAQKVVDQGIVNEAAALTCLGETLDMAGLRQKQLEFIVTTGYGRNLVSFGHKNVTEISCHARGAHYLFPEVRMVIDIGGQDSKVIALDGEGRVTAFNMNDKCAAGTGRFLEVLARALGVELEDMGRLSMDSTSPANVSSMCTVFAESEIVSLSAKGYAKVDIIAGLHEAIGRRLQAMVKAVGVHPQVMMSGGVAKNQGVVRVLERILGTEILVPIEPQIVGALGAALYALEEVKAGSSGPEAS